MDKVNLKEKLSLFDAHWTPKIVGELNGQYVKLAKLQGEFVWHDHKAEDEMFMVIQGTMTLQFRDREIVLHEGEFCIVPRGVEHKPVAENEVHVMLFEPKATLHTGSVQSDKTVTEQEWI